MSVTEAPITELEDPTVLTEAEQQLLNAERYMKEHGWCQGTTRSLDGRVCLMGSLMRHDSLACRLILTLEYECLRQAVEAEHPGLSIVDWNDNLCRNQEEALAMLRRARELVASKVAR